MGTECDVCESDTVREGLGFEGGPRNRGGGRTSVNCEVNV